MRGLDLASHVGEFHADDRVVDEAFPKRLALVSVFHGLLVADAGEAEALDDDADALVVEIGHDDFEALVLLAEEVLDGDLDVFEGDVGRSAGPDTLAVHPPGADAFGALDEEGGDAVHARPACSDGGGEVVAPDAVGDPFLFAVDDVVLPIF